MFNVNLAKRFSQALVFTALLVTISDFAWAEAKYNPYPIIFVHGYDNVRAVRERIDNLWFKPRDTLKEFLEYYPNWPSTKSAKFKYWNEDWDNYMAFFDYRAGSNGDINDIADKLGNYIDEIIDKLPDDQGKKVIIVAHSMGGLVTRRLLAKDDSYNDKIERVIFIGTPHLGSPQASGVILSDRMIPELEKVQAEHHKWTGIDRNLDFDWQIAVYSDRDKQITDALNLFHGIVNWNFVVNIKDMLDGDKNKLNPYGPPLDADSKGRYNPTVPHHEGQAVAVGQLVVPDSIAATKVFTASAYSTTTGTIVETEPLIAEPFYSQGDTFLNKNTLAQPDNFRTIVGTGSLTTPILGVGGSLIFKTSADYSLFPSGNTFEDLNAGDGIVTFSSQAALGGVIYQVPASHIEEVNHPATSKAILQAIDDKPVIEDVRVVRLMRSDYGYYEGFKLHRIDKTYIIIKAKDYLLADIEFETNIPAVNISEYRDDTNKPYKPYFKFSKDFLKERTELIKDTNGVEFPLRLQPGEFYLEVKDGLYKNSWVRLKNPAGKETECEIYTAIGGAYVARNGLSLSFWQEYNDPPDWQPLPNYSDNREMAYISFLSMPEELSRGDFLGVHLYGLGGYFNVEYYYPGRAAYISMMYSGFVTFNLNITDKKIKSAKFAGYVDKALEGGGDFKISILRDTSNTWPVTLNSRGDRPLFEVNTLSYQDTDSFETVIDSSNLNLNGYNVWQIRSDIPIPVKTEDNIIPASIPNEEIIRNFYVIYQRSFYINKPVLIIIYE